MSIYENILYNILNDNHIGIRDKVDIIENITKCRIKKDKHGNKITQDNIKNIFEYYSNKIDKLTLKELIKTTIRREINRRYLFNIGTRETMGEYDIKEVLITHRNKERLMCLVSEEFLCNNFEEIKQMYRDRHGIMEILLNEFSDMEFLKNIKYYTESKKSLYENSKHKYYRITLKNEKILITVNRKEKTIENIKIKKGNKIIDETHNKHMYKFILNGKVE